MVNNKKIVDMTQGNIVRLLIVFALPMIGSSILQQLYNTVDFLFIGNLLNKTSAAAVGASSTLISCVIGIFSGISVGTSVVCAQAIGGDDVEGTNKTLHVSLSFGMISGLLLTFLGMYFAPDILMLLNTPATVMTEATTYIRIYFLSIPAIVFYNMCSGAMRSTGDSRRPFLILLVCGLCNVAGDLFFMIVFPLGVAGVAIATVIAQLLSVLLCLFYLTRENSYFRLRLKRWRGDWWILMKVLKIGLPTGIQTVIITFSNIMVQYYINDFGETAMAAFSTYYKVENFIYLPIVALGQAMTTFSGQNTGGGQYRRIGRGTLVTMGIAVVVTLGISGTILWHRKRCLPGL